MSELTGKPYTLEFEVPMSAIDANGHVNNVEFVRWMQDIAIAHADTAGCTKATREANAMWLARSHHIEYRRPVFAGDRIRAITWLANVRRSFSLRKYRFERATDNTLLAEGETDWVLVDLRTGKPKSVPESIQMLFT